MKALDFMGNILQGKNIAHKTTRTACNRNISLRHAQVFSMQTITPGFAVDPRAICERNMHNVCAGDTLLITAE